MRVCYLCAEGPAAAGGAAAVGRDEALDVNEPGTAVELGVEGLDQPRLGTSAGVGVLHALANNDAGDGLRGEGSAAPAEEDSVAVVPHVQLVERNVCLRTLSGLEFGAGGEGGCAELCKNVVSA